MDISLALSLLQNFYLVVTAGLFLFFYTRKTSHPYRLWFLFGFAYNLFSLSVIYTAYPLPWLSLDNQLLYLCTFHLILAFVAGVPYTLLGYIHNKGVSSQLRPCIYAIAILCVEVLRSYTLSLLVYKAGSSSLGLHWSFGTLGSALSGTPLIEFAYIGGVYTLGALYVLILATLTTRNIKVIAVTASVLVISWLIIHYAIPLRGPSTTTSISIVGYTSPEEEDLSTQALRYKSRTILTSLLATSSSTLIVLPEDARFVPNLTQEGIRALSEKFSDSLVVDGDTRRTHGKLINISATYLLDVPLTARGKGLLFAFNEYIPSLFDGLLGRIIDNETFSRYKNMHTYSLHARPTTYTHGNISFAAIMCSELTSYEMVRFAVQGDPDIIIAQSHLPVFKERLWFFVHYLSYTKIAAAQARRPLVASSSNAPSMVVDGRGNVHGMFLNTLDIQRFEIAGGSIIVK